MHVKIEPGSGVVVAAGAVQPDNNGVTGPNAFEDEVALSDIYHYCFKPGSDDKSDDYVFGSEQCVGLEAKQMRPYDEIDTPFLIMFGEAITSFVLRESYINAHAQADALQVKPFSATPSVTIDAGNMNLLMGGRVSLQKVVNSYEVLKMFGLVWYVQAGNLGNLAGECCLPGWLVPTLAAKDKVGSMYNTPQF